MTLLVRRCRVSAAFAGLLLAATVAVAGCATRGASNRAAELVIVDHGNLRVPTDDRVALEADLIEIRRSMDAAVLHGAGAYVLFASGLESMLVYDFPLLDSASVAETAWGSAEARRRDTAPYRDAVREAARYAHERGLRILYHTNQFDFPTEVLEQLPGGRPCAADATTWQLFRAKLGELYTLVPELDGLVVTVDEADHPVWACEGQAAARAAVTRLMTETVQVHVELDKELMLRAWGRVPQLDDPEGLAAYAATLPPGVAISVKDTEGDFQLFAPDSPFLTAAGAHSVLELDAWREYSGGNLYPCYMGDIWAPRIRTAVNAGTAAVAVRINWSSDDRPLFDRPWGNLVNLDVARALAAGAEPDAALRTWVAEQYPPDAAEAAFALYKASADIQREWTSVGNVETTDHGRLFRGHTTHDVAERVADSLDRAQAEGNLTSAAAFAARRAAIGDATARALALVDDMPPSVREEWVSGLAAGARAEDFLARGSTYQLELLHARRTRDTDRLADLGREIRALDEEWRTLEPASYDDLNGDEAVRMLVEAP